MISKTLGFLLLLLLVVGPVCAANNTDLHMDSIGLVGGKLILQGHTTTIGKVWFVYGASSGSYSGGTPKVNLSVPSTITYNLSYGYYPGQTVYVRMANDTGYSPEELNFTLAPLTTMARTTYGSHLKNITKSNFDPLKLMVELPSAYGEQMGAPSRDIGVLIFWGFVCSCIFIVLYLRSENVMTPALLGMVIGWILLSYVPGDFKIMGEALLVVALGALLFTIIKGRIR